MYGIETMDALLPTARQQLRVPVTLTSLQPGAPGPLNSLTIALEVAFTIALAGMASSAAGQRSGYDDGTHWRRKGPGRPEGSWPTAIGEPSPCCTAVPGLASRPTDDVGLWPLRRSGANSSGRPRSKDWEWPCLPS